eukprot:198589-Hanusia_phi.AAC.1
MSWKEKTHLLDPKYPNLCEHAVTGGQRAGGVKLGNAKGEKDRVQVSHFDPPRQLSERTEFHPLGKLETPHKLSL